jgi:hypothetical protein
MANRKLSIGCVLVAGAALTNCGGVVESQRDDTQGERNQHEGNAGSQFEGTPGVSIGGGAPGAGSGPIVGVPYNPFGGTGGYYAGAPGYDGGAVGVGGAPDYDFPPGAGAGPEAGAGNQGGEAPFQAGAPNAGGWGGEDS